MVLAKEDGRNREESRGSSRAEVTGVLWKVMERRVTKKEKWKTIRVPSAVKDRGYL